MQSAIKNKFIKTFIVSIFVSAIVSVAMFAGFLNTWESKISDAFYTPSETLDEIVIVAIDDYSFGNLGMFPWPRSYFAEVINNLNESSVIGIDVIFDLATDTENDSLLAESIKNEHVVLAIEYTSFSVQEGKLYGETILKPNSTLGEQDVDFKTGFVNLYTDSDGVTRSFRPYLSGIENHEFFPLVIVNQYTGIKQDLKDSKMLIKFFDEPGGYEYISFSDVYNGNLDSNYFKGKIVLIGVTSPVMHDDYTVPISNNHMPGVEIHANLVQSILTRDFIQYQKDVLTIGFIFLFSLLTGILLFRFKMHIATALIITLFIMYLVVSILLTFYSGTIVNILFPLFSIASTYVILVVVYYRSEERNRKWITSLFGKYVSPVVIETLIQNPDKINLGGEKRDITIFFSDIRGFTKISENIPPSELVHLLNEYLSEMTSVITNNNGLVDKYMGDAIMAFWGAPHDQLDHAEVACSCSLEMLDKLRKLQKKWDENDVPSFDIGIGINSGEAIVGNMGSFIRFDYTAIGDNVNLASRLEGLNKVYGTNILIGENTYSKVEDKFETRKLDIVRVKGKGTPVIIYELIAKKNSLNKDYLEFIKLYETGLELYLKQKWEQAIEYFKKALKIRDDNASSVFITRCEGFLKNPPNKSWDGVCDIKTK